MIQVVFSAFFGEARKEKRGRLGMVMKMSTKPRRPSRAMSLIHVPQTSLKITTAPRVRGAVGRSRRAVASIFELLTQHPPLKGLRAKGVKPWGRPER